MLFVSRTGKFITMFDLTSHNIVQPSSALISSFISLQVQSNINNQQTFTVGFEFMNSTLDSCVFECFGEVALLVASILVVPSCSAPQFCYERIVRTTLN